MRKRVLMFEARKGTQDLGTCYTICWMAAGRASAEDGEEVGEGRVEHRWCWVLLWGSHVRLLVMLAHCDGALQSCC